MAWSVEPGDLCPTCGLRKDHLLSDGTRVLYGQGVGHLVITEEGRKFVAKQLADDLMQDVIMVAAHVASDPKMQIDDVAYKSARKLLELVTDIPDRLR